MTALAAMRAGELGREIEAGRVDPRALVEACLDAIANHPDAERVFARLTPARARAEAAEAAARAAAGLRRGPLDGVPVALKDLFDTAGVETEAGSRLLAGRIPEHDARCVAALAAAGMATLGKTHMSELAFSGLGVNPMTATPPGPYDPDWAPGGSSSGSASAVALGLAPAALGSDTGGSVRIPAAWQGLVGLKTTAGLLDKAGVVPLAPSLDTIGPITRNVEDAVLLLGALTGARPVDLAGADLKGASLFAPETAVLEDVEPEPLAAFEAALEVLGRAGARIARGPAPELAETLRVAAEQGAIVNAEGYAIWGARIEAQPELIYERIRARFRAGADASADKAEGARMAFRRLSRGFLARMAAHDAAVWPTTPILPPSVARLLADAEHYGARNLMALRNTRLGNLLGLCGLTIPTAQPACGLLFNGRPFEEARLLRLGAAAEAALAR